MPTVAIVESEMSLHAGQEKKSLQGQIIIAKVTLERAPYVISYNILALGPHSLRFYKRPTLAPKHWA